MENSMEFEGVTEDQPVIQTTYGSLRPGQLYRLPGGHHWYRRSKTARVTEAMRSRLVETLSS
jgi:hypothetical protein